MHIQSGEERLSLPFFKIEKGERCSDYGKKNPYFFVLRASRKKNTKMFPCGVSFSCVFDVFEMFIEVP